MPKKRIKKKAVGHPPSRKAAGRGKKKLKTIKKVNVLRTKNIKNEDLNPDNIFDSSTGKTDTLFISNLE